MNRRTIWVPAHQRRPPARPEAYVTKHLELFEAYRFDRQMAELREQIAAEVERDMQETR